MSSEWGEGTPSGSEEDEFGEPGETALAPAPAGEAAAAVGGIAKIPDWAEELLADLANGERIEARDQPRLTYALDLLKEFAAAVQQHKSERAAAALIGRGERSRASDACEKRMRLLAWTERISHAEAMLSAAVKSSSLSLRLYIRYDSSISISIDLSLIHGILVGIPSNSSSIAYSGRRKFVI